MKHVRFKDLKPGLQGPNTVVWLRTREVVDGRLWLGCVGHELIYVNTEAKEVCYRVFSRLAVMSADEFDCRGYEDRRPT